MAKDKNTENLNNSKLILKIAAIVCLACAFIISSVSFILTQSKYVTEIGRGDGSVGSQDNDLSFVTQTPYTVGTQMELFNAINSGYGYVRLSEGLDSPLIMTGNSLDLKKNLTIDLNGNEIERNSVNSLITVTDGMVLSIIDSKGGGGLYNPIGNVLAIDGGELNVFGGKFESGPRPAEYYSALIKESASNIPEIGEVNMLSTTDTEEISSAVMPKLKVRRVNGRNYGNVYVDKDITKDGAVLIPADTYCYMMINGVLADDVNSFEMSQASFVYTYTLPDDKGGEQSIVVFGYNNVIAKSTVENDNPNYAAVHMEDGVLRVNVTLTGDDGKADAIEEGSFYSYFGTERTSCVYLTGGTMDVSTSGSFSTVDPADLPEGVLSKDSEGSCIICAGDAVKSGTLNITKIKSANAYNGSIISMSGGELHLQNSTITKSATKSETNSLAFRKSLKEGGEYPAGQPFIDAAIFVNGGKVTINNCNVVLNKNMSYTTENNGSTGGGKLTTFGILARGRDGGNSEFTAENVDFHLYGSYNYGIFATRGDLRLTGGNFYIDNENNCYGVYAVNRSETNPVNVTLNGTHIELAKGLDVVNGSVTGRYETYVTETAPADIGLVRNSSGIYEKEAAVGVYLNSDRVKGGRVTINGSNIYSQEVGVAVNSGDIIFGGKGSIKTYNASAIGLNSGNITFSEDADYNIECELNRMGNGVAKNADGTDTVCSVGVAAARLAGRHIYEVYLPWQVVNDDESIKERVVEPYENNNCIRVIGGDFLSLGKISVKFRGMYNDFDGVYDATDDDPVVFDNIVIKSFAVCCTGGNINIKKADIVNTVGGGVKVDSGTIVLGAEGAPDSDINIKTLGFTHIGGTENLIQVASNIVGASYEGWKFYPNVGGGHAVIAREGDITVYNGIYTAEYSNGLAATGANTYINIYGGEFTGNMKHTTASTQTSSGPASHYGMKVMGGATVDIYGGKFDGRNGGALIRGQWASGPANVSIYRGEFGKADGQDGFNVYDYSNVYFGAHTAEQYTGTSSDRLITVYARLFPLAVNPILAGVPVDGGSLGNHINVYIYYGSYISANGRGTVHFDGALRHSTCYMYNFSTVRTSPSNVFGGRNANDGVIRYLTPTTGQPADCKYGYREYDANKPQVYYPDTNYYADMKTKG